MYRPTQNTITLNHYNACTTWLFSLKLCILTQTGDKPLYSVFNGAVLPTCGTQLVFLSGYIYIFIPTKSILYRVIKRWGKCRNYFPNNLVNSDKSIGWITLIPSLPEIKTLTPTRGIKEKKVCKVINLKANSWKKVIRGVSIRISTFGWPCGIKMSGPPSL